MNPKLRFDAQILKISRMTEDFSPLVFSGLPPWSIHALFLLRDLHHLQPVCNGPMGRVFCAEKSVPTKLTVS
jgi:hypothetical protein